MTTGFRLALIWIAGSLSAVLMSLNMLPASAVDGQYVPVGNDSFYHARRILDAVNDPGNFYEFDTRIHAPEGSQLTWPWGYDYLLAQLVRVSLATGLADEPMQALAHMPVALVIITIALVMGIAVQLRLSSWATLVAVLCVAYSPLTQGLHGVGIVDHHFAEMQFGLAALLCGLWWMNAPDVRIRAAVCGAVLGIAPAFQNGLFILQVPIVAAMLVLWVRSQSLPLRSVLTFGSALVVATLIALLPSEPFWQGRFEFYLFSWFHLYIAVGTAVVALFSAVTPVSLRTLLALVALGGVLLVPIASQALMGTNFLAGRLEVLPEIVEARSLATIVKMQGLAPVIHYYSFLIVLAPLVAVASALWLIGKRPDRPDTFFLASVLIGLVLLFLQFRLHVFGSFALYLPLLVAADRYASQAASRRALVMATLSAVFALSYLPSFQHQLFKSRTLANDTYYAGQRPLFETLAEACRRRPGAVLAGSDAGHYIRFHTDCSVIANNFLLTPQHERKYAQVARALDTPPDQFLQSAIGARYLLVSMADVASYPQEGNLVLDKPEAVARVRPRLAGPLLFLPPASVNPRFKLLAEVALPGRAAFGRLYEIEPVEPAVAANPVSEPASGPGTN